MSYPNRRPTFSQFSRQESFLDKIAMIKERIIPQHKATFTLLRFYVLIESAAGPLMSDLIFLFSVVLGLACIVLSFMGWTEASMHSFCKDGHFDVVNQRCRSKFIYFLIIKGWYIVQVRKFVHTFVTEFIQTVLKVSPI